MPQYTIPTVIEKTRTGERATDIFSRLLTERIVFLGTEIDDGVANVVMAQLLHLESDSADLDIALYVNSPGGSFTAMMAIYDTMQFIRPNVSTICLGQASSAAAVLLAAGATGKRFVLPHSRVVLHQPSASGQGALPDLAVQADEVMRVRAEVEQVLSEHTGQSLETLRRDTDRDHVFTAEQALAYGLVDDVISRRVVSALVA
ncbi:MAG: ClpP family protease [Nocardioidaceae bacterium]